MLLRLQLIILIISIFVCISYQAVRTNSVLNDIYSNEIHDDILTNEIIDPRYPQLFKSRLHLKGRKPTDHHDHRKPHHHTDQDDASDDTDSNNNIGNDYISCRDEQGKPVDWWILYKLPVPQKNHEKYSDSVTNGTGYTYILSNYDNQPWTLSELSMDDASSLPGQTLAPVYMNNTNLMTFMYNDEKPEGPTSFDLGHTKGVLFGDEYSGVWMIHSVPHFPPYPETGYGYPHTGHRYGQTFLCITVKSEAMNDVGRQFLYNQPFIYGVQMPTWTNNAKFSDLQQASEKGHIKEEPYYHEELLNTLGGVKLTSFAKYKLFNKDLYADLVAPSLKTSLLVETWPNGPGRMNSSCQAPYVVENIAELDFPHISNEDFTTRHDHAKWAISLDSKKPYVCIGDINRMLTQFKRGGGTTCFSNLSVWKTFKSSVKEIEACPARPRSRKQKDIKKKGRKITDPDFEP